MGEDRYDAIVVGARRAGSPTAMLLARKGYKVVVVDRATFPSDTLSTHILHPPGVAAMRRWDLLDRLVATGCPPIDTYSFDFGPFTISGSPGTVDTPFAYCPRRTVLDKLLVDAASEAGAEVREGFTVKEIVTEEGRVVGVVAGARTARTSPNAPALSSAPTGGSRRSRRPSVPSSTTRNRNFSAATTATGVVFPRTAVSRSTSAPTAPSRPCPRMTT